LMRWSSRVGDLSKPLFVFGPSPPDGPIQRLSASLSGSNPYTTCMDVNQTTFWPEDPSMTAPRVGVGRRRVLIPSSTPGVSDVSPLAPANSRRYVSRNVSHSTGNMRYPGSPSVVPSSNRQKARPRRRSYHRDARAERRNRAKVPTRSELHP